ncbi:MAG: PAS domain S-box protein, partial [Bacteroidota bacterium]
MKKILAIDDQVDNLVSIKAVIKDNIPDCEVLTAITGQDGIDIAIREHPDTILLDIIMPEMDGFETCIKLKENTSTKHIPVVMLTAIKTDSKSRAKGLNIGADAFLSKPIDALELTAQVNVMLRIKDAEDKLRKEKDVLEELVLERTRDLSVSEEKYHSIFEGVKDGIIYISKDIKVIASNRAFSEITGISNEEVLGKSGISLAKKFVSTKQLPVVLSYLKSLLLDKTPNNFVINYLDKILEISSQRLENGRRVVVIRDITERRQAEKDLKESKERYDLALNATKDGIYDWNLLDNTIYYSPAWKSILGYEDDELPNDFSIWEKLTKPEDVKRSWEMQNQVINKERDLFEMEFKMKHKDGHWVDILSRAEAYFDKSGKAIRMVGTHIDITERKKIENELFESEQLFRLMAENSTDTIWLMQLDGKFLYHSPAVMQLRGYTPEEANKLSMQESMTPPSIKFLNKVFAREDAKPMKERWNSLRFELEMFRKDGSKIWTEVSAKAVFDDNNQMVALQGATHDITEHKQADEEIQKSNSLLSSIIESPDNVIMFALDLDYKYLSFNKAHIKEMKLIYDSDIEIGHSLLNYIPTDEDQLNAIKNYERVVSGERFIIIQEYGKGESRFWYELIFNPIIDNLTNVSGLTVFITNITERKLVEEELKKHRNHLEELVKERTSEL